MKTITEYIEMYRSDIKYGKIAEVYHEELIELIEDYVTSIINRCAEVADVIGTTHDEEGIQRVWVDKESIENVKKEIR